MPAITVGFSEFEARLKRIRRRVNLHSLVEALCISAACLLLAGTLSLVAAAALSEEFFTWVYRAALAAAVAAIAVSIWRLRGRWLDLQGTAIHVDRCASMDARVATLLAHPQADATSPLRPILLWQIFEHSSSWDVDKVAPWRIGRPMLACAAAVAVFATALLLAPPRQKDPPPHGPGRVATSATHDGDAGDNSSDGVSPLRLAATDSPSQRRNGSGASARALQAESSPLGQPKREGAERRGDNGGEDAQHPDLTGAENGGQPGDNDASEASEEQSGRNRAADAQGEPGGADQDPSRRSGSGGEDEPAAGQPDSEGGTNPDLASQDRGATRGSSDTPPPRAKSRRRDQAPQPAAAQPAGLAEKPSADTSSRDRGEGAQTADDVKSDVSNPPPSGVSPVGPGGSKSATNNPMKGKDGGSESLLRQPGIAPTTQSDEAQPMVIQLNAFATNPIDRLESQGVGKGTAGGEASAAAEEQVPIAATQAEDWMLQRSFVSRVHQAFLRDMFTPTGE